MLYPLVYICANNYFPCNLSLLLSMLPPTHTGPHTPTPYTQSFLSDDDDGGGGEASWDDTEQLTKPPGNGHVISGGDDRPTVFKNSAFEGGNELQLADYDNHDGDQGNRSAANTSHF